MIFSAQNIFCPRPVAATSLWLFPKWPGSTRTRPFLKSWPNSPTTPFKSSDSQWPATDHFRTSKLAQLTRMVSHFLSNCMKHVYVLSCPNKETKWNTGRRWHFSFDIHRSKQHFNFLLTHPVTLGNMYSFHLAVISSATKARHYEIFYGPKSKNSILFE